MTQVRPADPVTIPAAPGAAAGLAGARIVALDCYDVRFPTSLEHDGSDAMNPDPDYSAAYAILRTDAEGLEGHALCFTIGRGNEVMVTAIAALRRHVVGRRVEDIAGDLGAFSAALIGDSQLRWLGPEKGVMHMAIGAVVNAAWDLAAKIAGKPVWRLLADMTPEQIVALVDFRYLSDALTPAEAMDILRAARAGREERIAELERFGHPAYTTTPGWIGYSDEKLVSLSRQAVADGFTQIKLKVGADLPDDVRRMALAREAVGPDIRIAVDANQRWGVGQATDAIAALAPWDPYWVEEPTSPDEILGLAVIHDAIAPVKIAVGEHVANRVIFKQILQAGGADVLTIDACRVAGVNENVAILLLAAKYGVAVCPHAGGVGLCEMVQHLAMFDFVAVAATHKDRVLEYVDHLHEHFTDPVRVTGGRYLAPTAPGFSAELRPESLRAYEFPHGAVWQELAGTANQ
ncbi:enolase C-terminal domain-like protein [Trebonia kvetii]|uniref:enolase C-terminal domain-like protein n=1 Tax=Trebonia kvetii TaxID=2480626 RepID=UPI001FEC1072|nr:enolase C-terminal domain-like protein [Trebonia kvetii]